MPADWRPGDPVWHGEIGGRRRVGPDPPAPNGIRIAWQGMSVDARVMLPRIAALERLMPEKLPPDTSKLLLCPMPGLVVSIAVTEGQEVKAGETLAVVEAMKMENVLRAERDLTVARSTPSRATASPSMRSSWSSRDRGGLPPARRCCSISTAR